MSFGGFILTNKGLALQAKVQAGTALHFNRIGIGDGNIGATPIPNLNALVSQKQSISISKLKTQQGGKAIIGGVLSNKTISTGFYLREIGFFAQDPTEGEILYCYANAGAGAEFISADGGTNLLEKNIDLLIISANASAITATVASGIYASVDDVGNMSTVPTTSKNAAGAITELFQSVSDGKFLLAAAITGKGVPTAASDTFLKMAINIGGIVLGSGNAQPGDVREGMTFSNDGGPGKVGTKPVQSGGNVIPIASDIVKPAGIYDTAITVKGVVVPAAKVLNDTTIAGTQGSMPNRTGHVTGQSISRSGTILRIRPQQGHYPADAANSVQWDEPNWLASNIPKDVSMFGVEGALSAILSIQRGIATVPANTTSIEVPINSVGVHNAARISLTNQGSGNLPGSALASIEVQNYSKINIVKSSEPVSRSYEWEVYNFNGKLISRVQRYTFSSGSPTYTLHTPIDPSKTIIIYSVSSSVLGAVAGGYVYIEGSNTLGMSALANTAFTVYLIEFK